jgi:hypothetical protein
MRARVGQTGRWPVLTMPWQMGESDSWEEQVRDGALFSRFYFEEERRDSRKSDTPDAIVQAAAGLNIAAAFGTFREDSSLTAEEYLGIAVKDTQQQFGQAPVISDPVDFMNKNRLRSYEDVERWFFDWEIAHCQNPLDLPEYGLMHLSWFDPKPLPQALLLMPSPRGWEVPAYISWFGAYLCNSQFIVALLKEWHCLYGAELVAHFGTMMQFKVARRPQTAEEAFHLAWQQHMVAPCTTILPGVSVRDHARALLHTDKWFLHEKP